MALARTEYGSVPGDPSTTTPEIVPRETGPDLELSASRTPTGRSVLEDLDSTLQAKARTEHRYPEFLKS